MKESLNIVFHNIREKGREINNEFSVTESHFHSVREKLLELSEKNKLFRRTQYYFDDGHVSFLEKILPSIDEGMFKCFTLSMPTNFVGRKNYLGEAQLKELSEMGIKIASHGVSHSALAIYVDDVLQRTPSGGLYRNTLFGKGKILSEKEVEFQLVESKKALERVVGVVDEFVFPFGLYNKDTLEINRRLAVYEYLAACDGFLDDGNNLRQRYLVWGGKTVDEVVEEIRNLETFQS